jgi:hypothetical protein
LLPWNRRRRRKISFTSDFLRCGLFMAKLKEIARASSYGDRGLKVLLRLLLLIEKNVKLMRRLGAIVITLEEDSGRVVQL